MTQQIKYLTQSDTPYLTSHSNSHLNLKGLQLLIVESNPNSLRILKKKFQILEMNLRLATNLQDAIHIIQTEQLHAILIEYSIYSDHLSDIFYKHHPEGLFYIMSDKKPLGIKKYISKGITDFFKKPIVIKEFIEKLEKKLVARSTSISTLDPVTKMLQPFLLFRSEIMKKGLIALPKLSRSKHSILITGETGTGKEMVARAIHNLSLFHNGPFIALNCGAIPENLIESELFGHEKGAFTGANTIKKGKFELAQKGTLFLDEIGEMPLSAQVRLLRALEEKEIYRIGAEKPVITEVRVVAATRANLEENVENGLFREDLYYRLNILRIQLPPLRERVDDISLLAWHFLERAFIESEVSPPYPTLSKSAIKLLEAQPWKGNVRELRNIMSRIAVLIPHHIKEILPEHLKPHLPIQKQEHTIQNKPGIFIPIGTTLKDAEEKLIIATLNHTQGNRTHAAKILNVGVRTIRRKVNEK